MNITDRWNRAEKKNQLSGKRSEEIIQNEAREK